MLGYQTKFIYGSFSFYFLLIGLIPLLPKLGNKINKGITKDYKYLLIILVCIIFGSILNINTVVYSNIQAYLLMAITFFYVKETAIKINFKKTLTIFFTIFLITNTILMVFQLIYGGPFIHYYLSNAVTYRVHPVGWADGEHMNSLSILTATGYLMGIFLEGEKSISKRLIIISLIFGICSILLTNSRAGITAMVVLLVIFNLISPGAKLFNKLFFIFISILILGLFGILYVNLRSVMYSINLSSISEISDFTELMIMKYENFFDESLEERLFQWQLISEFPIEQKLCLLTVGIGPGSFENMYTVNMHNSWLELLVTCGIVSLFAFILFLKEINKFFRIKKVQILNNKFLLPMISVLIFMMAHDVLRNRYFWLFAGLLAAQNIDVLKFKNNAK